MTKHLELLIRPNGWFRFRWNGLDLPVFTLKEALVYATKESGMTITNESIKVVDDSENEDESDQNFTD